MSCYLVVFIRKINSLCFTTVFLSNSYRTQEGSFICFYSFRSSHERYSLKKGIIKNFAEFLRTFFLSNTFKQLILSFWSSDNLLTVLQKIDLCYIKSSFQIYQLNFWNKKLTEVFVYILNWFKTNEKMGRSHEGFYPNATFFKTWVIKPGELLSTFWKKQKNEFICVKLVIMLIFGNEKVLFIIFLSKI